MEQRPQRRWEVEPARYWPGWVEEVVEAVEAEDVVLEVESWEERRRRKGREGRRKVGNREGVGLVGIDDV